MENENVVADNSNTAEEVVLETTEETTPENVEENVDEVKAKLAKAEELANNYKIRAEKAEKLAKTVKVEAKPEPSKPQSMSTRDYIALVNSKINEEDIVEVEDYAKYKGISIADALKSSVVKTLLSEKEEIRKTAQATNTSNARRGSSQVSPETLLAKARKGDVPDSDDEIQKLIRSRKAYSK
jgi:LPS O-antigen subunit length determinant protein (WzzB/FepE family)